MSWPTPGGCDQAKSQSRECDKPRVPGSFRGECHNCGETGHQVSYRSLLAPIADKQSRECDQPRDYDRLAGSGGDGGYGTKSGGGGGVVGGDWGTPEPAASGWGAGTSFISLPRSAADVSEQSTPALVADTSAGGKLPQSCVVSIS